MFWFPFGQIWSAEGGKRELGHTEVCLSQKSECDDVAGDCRHDHYAIYINSLTVCAHGMLRFLQESVRQRRRRAA